METMHKAPALIPVIEQVSVKSTSWIGQYMQETRNRTIGQTFICPAGGELNSIQIFVSLVAKNGPVEMTIHNFDPKNFCWGPAIGTACVNVKRNDSGKWIGFPLKGLHFQLQKGHCYGFRLKNDAGFVGIGEAPVNYASGFLSGQEWNISSPENKEKYFTYISLAFKVEMRA